MKTIDKIRLVIFENVEDHELQEELLEMAESATTIDDLDNIIEILESSSDDLTDEIKYIRSVLSDLEKSEYGKTDECKKFIELNERYLKQLEDHPNLIESYQFNDRWSNECEELISKMSVESMGAFLSLMMESADSEDEYKSEYKKVRELVNKVPSIIKKIMNKGKALAKKAKDEANEKLKDTLNKIKSKVGKKED